MDLRDNMAMARLVVVLTLVTIGKCKTLINKPNTKLSNILLVLHIICMIKSNWSDFL